MAQVSCSPVTHSSGAGATLVKPPRAQCCTQMALLNATYVRTTEEEQDRKEQEEVAYGEGKWCSRPASCST